MEAAKGAGWNEETRRGRRMMIMEGRRIEGRMTIMVAEMIWRIIIMMME
jgi:hypothetical protein